MNDIIKADKKYRRQLFIFYGTLLTVSIIILILAVPPLRFYHSTLAAADAIYFVETIQALLLLSVIVPAFSIIRLGIKILKAKEYPLKNMKMIRDTEIKSGEKALKIGRHLIGLGAFSIILIVISLFANHTINTRFIENPLSFVPAHVWEEFNK